MDAGYAARSTKPSSQPDDMRQDRSFAELMMRSLMVADKLSEEALICALDMARAFFRLHPADEGAEHPLQMVAHDVAHEVKVRSRAVHEVYSSLCLEM